MTDPYYSDGLVTIYHGDCREILSGLSGVDLFFTSPPYNLGTSTGGIHAGSLAAVKLADGYASYGDDMPQDEYDDWQREVVGLMWDSLSDTGAIFYNHKPRSMNGTVVLPTIYGDGLPLRQVIIWNRETGLNFSPTFFLPKCEWIMVWAKSGWSLIDRSASQVGDVWTIRPENSQRHPAPFPLALPKRAIAATTAALVCDPFMGSGTTLRAAKDLGRRAVGIEIEERYCEAAVARLAQEVLL
jgi:site-specific DNA-methyltransferase (adenine-specific)